jgi:hypothetical protein
MRIRALRSIDAARATASSPSSPPPGDMREQVITTFPPRLYAYRLRLLLWRGIQWRYHDRH